MDNSLISTTEVTAEANGRTPTTDIIVGVAMMILSVLCGLAYSLILNIIYRDKDLFRLPSYKIMFMLGVYDIIQLFPHFITGIFTICQSVWAQWFGKSMGVLATPGYVGYTTLTVILSLNRFLQVALPRFDAKLFSKKTVYFWLASSVLIFLLFALALASPWACIIYNPEWYSWDYDRINYPYSQVVQDVEEFIEVGGIFVSAFFYIIIVILLCRTRRRFMVSNKSYAEIRVLIQAFIITAYCSVLNIFWHNSAVLLPENIWSYMALNFMWIFNSGIYPLIYFIVNTSIRKKLQAVAPTAGAVSMFVKPKQSSLSQSTAQLKSKDKLAVKSRFPITIVAIS